MKHKATLRINNNTEIIEIEAETFAELLAKIAEILKNQEKKSWHSI